MQAQKQIHASQLWQQGLNDVILKSCDTIVLKTLPLVVQCKFFRWWVRKHETISTKEFTFLIVTLWIRQKPYSGIFYPMWFIWLWSVLKDLSFKTVYPDHSCKHLKKTSIQRRIQNTFKHLRWSVLRNKSSMLDILQSSEYASVITF